MDVGSFARLCKDCKIIDKSFNRNDVYLLFAKFKRNKIRGMSYEGFDQVRPFAVDVSSGIESAKGIKDDALMRAFVSAVRAADEQ